MTIPTRDELIERAAKALAELPGKMTYPQGDPTVTVRWWALHACLVSEIRRAVAEELQSLRQHSDPVGDVDDHREYWRGVARERGVWIAWIDARLAALREPTKVGECAGIPIKADPSVKPGTIEARAGNVAAPALSDADVLERAAELLRESGWREATPDELLLLAEKCRAASAPVPVPKPVDPIERVIACAAEVEVITDEEERAALASLSALRQRAQEASR